MALGQLTFPVMGVDVGVNGGLAVLRADGTVEHLRAFKPTMTYPEIVAAARAGLEALIKIGGYAVFIEVIGHMPHDGGLGSITFGRVDGLLRGALLALGAVMKDVTPVAWQSKLDCLSGGDKNVTKRRAKELFPAVKITHAVADALLIAEYGRRKLAF